MNHAKAAYFDHMVSAPWAMDLFPGHPKPERLLTTAAIRPGMRVLEPGCVAGRLTALLADAVGPNGQVVAVNSARTW